MNILLLAFQELLYRPLFNALIALYTFLPGHDLGVAIIVLTLLVRLLLFPLVDRQYKSQRALTALQPRLQEIRKKVKDSQEQSKQIMELYKEAGVHPASGCLPLLVQLPVLFALYRAFINGLNTSSLDVLYSWVPRPEEIHTIAFGFLFLASPNIVLALLAGIFQFIQSCMMLPPRSSSPKSSSEEPDMANIMNTQMVYVMPAMTALIALRFPAGLALYWVTTTLVAIAQQYFLKKRHGATHQPTPIVS